MWHLIWLENGEWRYPITFISFPPKNCEVEKTFDQDLPQKQFYLGFPALISPLKVFIFELVAETFLVLFTMQYACSGRLKKCEFVTFKCQRPYHIECTSSRPITEVQQHWALLVLGWVTAWEYRVLLASFLSSLNNTSEMTKVYI